MSKNIVLEVKNLRKSFGDFVAIDDISFSLEEGQILGIATTLIGIVLLSVFSV